VDDEKRRKMRDQAKADRELEKELRQGWGNASTLSLVHRPDEAGKRIKPAPRLDELDKWD